MCEFCKDCKCGSMFEDSRGEPDYTETCGDCADLIKVNKGVD